MTGQPGRILLPYSGGGADEDWEKEQALRRDARQTIRSTAQIFRSFICSVPKSCLKSLGMACRCALLWLVLMIVFVQMGKQEEQWFWKEVLYPKRTQGTSSSVQGLPYWTT
jgi:hypothetical protein